MPGDTQKVCEVQAACGDSSQLTILNPQATPSKHAQKTVRRLLQTARAVKSGIHQVCQKNSLQSQAPLITVPRQFIWEPKHVS
jgi:hypothetical protein